MVTLNVWAGGLSYHIAFYVKDYLPDLNQVHFFSKNIFSRRFKIGFLKYDTSNSGISLKFPEHWLLNFKNFFLTAIKKLISHFPTLLSNVSNTPHKYVQHEINNTSTSRTITPYRMELLYTFKLLDNLKKQKKTSFTFELYKIVRLALWMEMMFG